MAKARPGTSVSEFFTRFPDKNACVRHLFEMRWGNHRPCRSCAACGRWRQIGSTSKFAHSCGYVDTVTRGTILYRSNLSLMAWFYALLLFCNSSHGMRSGFIRKQLGIGARSSHRLSNAIRYLLAASDRPAQLGGPGKMVHVDEVFLRYFKETSDENAIVWGCACDGQVLSAIIPDTKRSTLSQLIRLFIRPGSIVVTDGHPSYRHLAGLGIPHIRIDHKRAFHNFGGVTNNPIESYWAVLRRTLSAYRSIGRDNLWLYLAETEHRYNRRHSHRSVFDEMCERLSDASALDFAATRSRFDFVSGDGAHGRTPAWSTTEAHPDAGGQSTRVPSAAACNT